MFTGSARYTNAEFPPFKEIKPKERFQRMSHVVILLKESGDCLVPTRINVPDVFMVLYTCLRYSSLACS